MKRRILFLMLLCLSGLIPQQVLAKDPCLECHESKTPGIVRYWQESVHAEKQVTCVSCHGHDAEENHTRSVTVSAEKCKKCHEQAYAGHVSSRHGIGLKTGRGCTRNITSFDEREKTCILCHDPGSTRPKVATECAMFLAQSPEMQRQGCDSCHRIEVRCDTCHTKHGTDRGLARMPEICGTCHIGPDHAQFEMWETSPHGVLYRKSGEAAGPSCTTCHMKDGSHDVSRGISTGLPDAAALQKGQEREFMLDICASCHSRSLARRNLDDADKIVEQSRALVAEAQEIVEKLRREDLLRPSPAERPAHPLFGQTFIIGPHMLYENLSAVESLFFKMKQFYYMNTTKGAFHQNPDYTHWYGNAPLKLTLSEIRSEAYLLRRVQQIMDRIENLSRMQDPDSGEAGDLKKNLRELNEKKNRDQISAEEFQDLKDRILKEKGL